MHIDACLILRDYILLFDLVNQHKHAPVHFAVYNLAKLLLNQFSIDRICWFVDSWIFDSDQTELINLTSIRHDTFIQTPSSVKTVEEKQWSNEICKIIYYNVPNACSVFIIQQSLFYWLNEHRMEWNGAGRCRMETTHSRTFNPITSDLWPKPFEQILLSFESPKAKET